MALLRVLLSLPVLSLQDPSPTATPVRPESDAWQPSAVELPLATPPSVWWGDYDGDGRDDAWVVQPSLGGKLLRNAGPGVFEDVTVRAGLAETGPTHMAAWGDANGDGRLDLYLPVLGGKSSLHVQNETGVFVDVTEASGLPPFLDPSHARWIELDGDGLPELWLTTAIDDLVYANRGALGFQRVDLFTEPRDPWLASAGMMPIATSGFAGVTSGGPGAPAPTCLPGIRDQAQPTTCISASSDPVLGSLYPLSTFLFVQATTGRVGINTTSPATQLDVQGSIRSSEQIVSTASSGPPLVVSSSTVVSNLNADLLDGLQASAFATLPVVSTDVADGSLTGTDVADGSLTGTDLAGDTITATHIASAAVGSAEIQDGSVTSADIAADTITAADVATDSIGTAELAPSSVGSSEIVDGSVTSADLANDSVGSPEIAVSAVGSPEIMDGGVTAADLAADSVGSSELAANAVGTFEIIDGSVTSADLATDSVGGAAIAPNAVGTSEIANGSVDLIDLVSPLDGVTSGIILHVQNDTTGTQGKAIQAETSATGGVAIEALALSNGAGVTYGVKGLSASSSGVGVWGRANGSGANFGVFGETFSGSSGAGVQGVVSASSGVGSCGVRGLNACASGINYGLRGESSSSTGRGVFGLADEGTGTNYGVRGQTASASGYGLSSLGDLIATGTKSFVQPHPSDPSRQIRFVCLEGNESGTYFRGSARVEAGLAVIEVPEEFRLVTDEEGLTVQVTPLGPTAGLWVESKGLDQIVVRATGDVEFDYLVNGVRRGFRDIDLVRPNTEFVPTVRGVPFGTQYPRALRDLLVQNGILNADYTPNEATAQALGWQLVEAGVAETLSIER